MGSRLSNLSVRPGQKNPIDSNTIRSSSLRDYTTRRTYPSAPSLPGLTRQSIHLRKDLLAKKMDARVVSAFTRVFDALLPAHDEYHSRLITPFGLTAFCTIPFLPAAHLRPSFCILASPTPKRGVGGAPRNVRVQRHPLGVS